MSTRKRPLSELAQPQAPRSYYTPSTPHARKALQDLEQRNSASASASASANALRSNKSLRSGYTIHRIKPVTNTKNGISADILGLGPNRSARNILRQFARITAPITKKRVETPTSVHASTSADAGQGAGEEDDSILLSKRPGFTFDVEDGDGDSEVLIPPTPSVLPDDDDQGLEEEETVTFHRDVVRAASEKIDRRRSRVSAFGMEDYNREGDEGMHGHGSGDQGQDRHGGDDEDDFTIMTERGRRALSEEATGRFSRYSFGSIRMSDFGSELEIRRESNRQQKLAELEDEDGYAVFDGSATMDLAGETENFGRIQDSPLGGGVPVLDDSIQDFGLGDDTTFRLPMPEDNILTVHGQQPAKDRVPPLISRSSADETELRDDVTQHNIEDEPLVDGAPSSRRQTMLEVATSKAQASRRKRVKLTRHGTVVPLLPTSLIKRVAAETQTRQGRRKPKLGRDHVQALEQATEWFFEQVGEDLAAYSSHGRRKRKVDDDDVLLLMKRQKFSLSDENLMMFAKDWLPADIEQGLDLPEQL